ncbi:MAG: acyl-CoA dehydrogenase family protein, partial [Desulfotomaculales bacterium]
DVAMAVTVDAVQIHGGYGYMEEYPIARFYRDVRAHTIYAGTSEIMKTIIAKKLGF